jgi:hypothetical protein
MMRYVPLVYSVTIPVHGSGLRDAHHQEGKNVYMQQLVRVVSFS